VIVATILAGDEPATQEQAVLEFLNGDLVLAMRKRWVLLRLPPPNELRGV
jgi:hypothetical protein